MEPSSVAIGHTQLPHASRAASVPSVAVSVEAVVWGVVLLSTAAVRLAALDAVPFAPAESVRARAAFDLASGMATPAFGGDLASGLTALLVRAFGASAWTVRLAPALLGIAAVAVIALYRPLIGRGGALLAAALLAVSPVAVVTARTLGPEAAALPLALALPPLAKVVLLEGHPSRLPWLALVVGFGLGTGAVFTATLLVVIVWLGIESAWRGRAVTLHPMRLLRERPAMALLAFVALFPGLALAVARYGAGMQRVSLAAVRAWQGPPTLTAGPTPWHTIPDVLLAYEPLAFVLGMVGLVGALRAWRSTDADGPRLLAVWAISGVTLCVLWLHREPGQTLIMTAPLALLGGWATARLLRPWTHATWRAAIVLLPLLPGLGYLLLLALRWADTGEALTAELLSAVFVLLGVGAAVGVGLVLVRGQARTLLLVTAWAVLGALTLHAATSAAYGGGTELLTGLRTLPTTEAVVRDLLAAAPPDAPLCVERRLWPALAWPLRDREVRQFVETPPCFPAAVVAPEERLTDVQPARPSIAVIERWTPPAPQLPDLARWWLTRRAWGDPTITRAAVVQR